MREEVKWFAEQMEEVLKQNDHKGGWQDMCVGECFDRLIMEMRELKDAILNGGAVTKEAVDVANFAMFIADNYRRRKND